MYIHRDIEKELQEALKQFPAILITGPRQAGKSTLLRQCLPNHTYISLDDAETRLRITEDPKLFLKGHPAPLILDEIQYAPQLLSYIKILIDEDRDKCGQFVLTGSQIFQLMEGVSESLAGRVCIFHLHPFSWNEIGKGPKRLQVDLTDERAVADRIVRGFYPEVFKKPELNWSNWYGSYISTYLERDLRNIKAISDLDLFQRFIEILATRVGSLLNLSELSKEVGVSQPTARSWLGILESTYLVFRLRPYFRNHGKRVVRSPKLYFHDTGLACHLLAIDSPDRLLRASERGHLFENMIIAEWVKRESLAARPRPLHFYRTPGGAEVDLLVERPEQMYAFEIKFARSLNSRMVSGLSHFLRDHPATKGYLLSLSEAELLLAPDIQAIHWSQAFNVVQ